MGTLVLQKLPSRHGVTHGARPQHSIALLQSPHLWIVTYTVMLSITFTFHRIIKSFHKPLTVFLICSV